MVQRIKEKTGRDIRRLQDVAPGRQVVTDLDFFARGVIIQEDIRGVLGDDGLKRRGPPVERVFLPDGRPRVLASHSLDYINRLRPEMPGQPQDL